MTRRTAVPRGKPPRRRNAKRHSRNWTRAFGSEARVEFVRSLACVTCGRRGNIQCSHIPNAEGRGMARRGNADQTVPQCPSCHMRLHELGPRAFPDFDWKAAAAHTEASFQLFCEDQT